MRPLLGAICCVYGGGEMFPLLGYLLSIGRGLKSVYYRVRDVEYWAVGEMHLLLGAI